MNLNLKGWVKAHEAPDHTIMRDKAGHELKIHHKPLSAKMRAGLKALPLADGGMVHDANNPKLEESKKTPPEESPLPGAKHLLDNTDVDKRKIFSDKFKNMADGGQVTDETAEDEIKKASPDFLSHPDIMTTPPPPVPSEESIAHAIGAHLGNAISNSAKATGEAANTVIGKPIMAGANAVGDFTKGALGIEEPKPELTPAGPVAPTPQAAPQQQPQAPAATAPAQQPPADQFGLQAATEAAGQALAEQKGGLGGEAQAMEQKGEQEAHVLHQAAQQEAKQQAAYQDRVNSLNAERASFMQDIKDQKINPDRVWQNKSTGSKISTAIGLILGGMGGGLTGQENPALKFLNQQIDNDIKAQEKELSSKHSLLSANMQQFGDLTQATNMTRIMQTDIISNKLKEAAAKAQGPMAQARLMQAVGQLDAQNAVRMQAMAASNVLGAAEQEAKKNPALLPQYIDAVAKIDPKKAEDLRGRMVPGMGLATSDKGAQKVIELKGSVDTARDAIKELGNIAKIPGKSVSLEQRAKADTIAQSLIGILRVPLTGPGAMSEGERKMLENIIANPTSIFSLDNTNKVKLNTLSHRLGQSLNMVAQANGIMPTDPVLALPPNQQAMARWAQQNPKDPRSKVVLEKLGIQ